MSFLASFKNLFHKKTISDDSAEGLKKEIALLMAELKKLYEKNAELVGQNKTLSDEVKRLKEGK